MDEPAPGVNPLAEGWAAMGAIYRAAWERALQAPADRGAVSAVLGDALERMLLLTEAAEAQVFGAANGAWPVANKAEYASVGERIEGVLGRLSKLEEELSRAVMDEMGSEEERCGPRSKKAKGRGAKNKGKKAKKRG